MTKPLRPRFVFVDPEMFYLERRTAGLTRSEAARYLGVTVRTIRNWENAFSRIPYPAFKLLRMRAGGIVQAPGWEGWRFGRGGALYSPCGRSFLSWELYHIRHMFSMAQHFRDQYTSDRRAGDAQASPPRLARVEVSA